ncbi:DUF4145 domain-containing protein [Mycobacterium numidiamassiliense]|uniref:DUF4145 domain-containing protein n=1 Tax=Mycobacterium numidiamassiliense TaxID=1841861 RepID=UPI001FE75D22|nr:DUF4145 domain-containing protein [Mycobacterium numidiamassiliense]
MNSWAMLTLTNVSPSRPVSRPAELVTVLQCQGCTRQSVVVEAEIGDQYGLKAVMWWPSDDIADVQSFAATVPSDVLEAYSEGSRCLAVQAPNAAAAMFRTTIAQIVQDKGSDDAKAKPTLNAAIIQMEQDGTMWSEFGDWAHHIRHTGNAGAHGEAFDPLDMEQATDLQTFIQHIIEFLYVQPARRAAARAATRRAAPPGDV